MKQKGSESSKGYFRRYVPNVPFQVEALSRWISNVTEFDKPYVEYDRSVHRLKASHPGDFKKAEEGSMKLVLFYK